VRRCRRTSSRGSASFDFRDLVLQSGSAADRIAEHAPAVIDESRGLAIRDARDPVQRCRTRPDEAAYINAATLMVDGGATVYMASTKFADGGKGRSQVSESEYLK